VLAVNRLSNWTAELAPATEMRAASIACCSAIR
jgi:hypothetical protein